MMMPSRAGVSIVRSTDVGTPASVGSCFTRIEKRSRKNARLVV
jgi:hypothetical protein